MISRRTLARPPRTVTRRPWFALRAYVSLLLVAAATPARADDNAERFYVEQIKPLLSEKCVSCHGPLEQQAGLRLDAGQLIHLAAADSDLLVFDSPEQSELLFRVAHDDVEMRMPPPGEGTPLDAEELQRLSRWIAAGAPFPADEQFVESPDLHWAFQKIIRPPLPDIDTAFAGDEAVNPIDAFLQAKRIERGTRVLEPADDQTFRRRLHFDLTGLPPDSTAFAAAAEPVGSLRLIDELLSSPDYAERWARHWMDVWRYSDWDGYKDELRSSQRHIWHWREWIIDSLAEDKPYDRMIVEMLAADEAMPLDADALRATGFLARNYHKSNRNIWLDATVEHTAKAFLGLTVDCAKCHDHKYDPIPQDDFYRFRAIFEPHNTRTDFVTGQADRSVDGVPRAYDADLDAKTAFLIAGDEKRPDESRQIEPDVPRILGIDLRIEPVHLPPEARIPQLNDEVRRTLVAAEEAKAAEAEAKAAAAPDDPLARLQADAAQAALASFLARYDADTAKHLGDEDDVQRLGVEAAAMQLRHRAAEAELAAAVKRGELAAAESAETEAGDSEQEQARQKRIDEAKSALDKAEKTQADAQAALEKHAAEPTTEYDAIFEVFPETSSGRRLALARFLTDPQNPLTARVAVNHIWMRHFGTPLVDNVFDFGLNSPEPLHRELLDWLACELIEAGWRMKPLHRRIVSSHAYRLASSGDPSVEAENLRVDPDNTTYWRFTPRRLEAEAIRDSLLAVGGSLDRRRGGGDIDHGRGEEVPRRSLYFRHAYEKQMRMLVTFDAAAPGECYRRDSSIVPQQALVLANSAMSRRMSEALAARLASNCGSAADGSNDADAFVDAAFASVLGRPPTADEQQACRRFLDNFADDQAADQQQRQQAYESLIHVLINHNDFVTVR